VVLCTKFGRQSTPFQFHNNHFAPSKHPFKNSKASHFDRKSPESLRPVVRSKHLKKDSKQVVVTPVDQTPHSLNFGHFVDLCTKFGHHSTPFQFHNKHCCTPNPKRSFNIFTENAATPGHSHEEKLQVHMASAILISIFAKT
jgi:hypothetical protein